MSYELKLNITRQEDTTELLSNIFRVLRASAKEARLINDVDMAIDRAVELNHPKTSPNEWDLAYGAVRRTITNLATDNLGAPIYGIGYVSLDQISAAWENGKHTENQHEEAIAAAVNKS